MIGILRYFCSDVFISLEYKVYFPNELYRLRMSGLGPQMKCRQFCNDFGNSHCKRYCLHLLLLSSILVNFITIGIGLLRIFIRDIDIRDFDIFSIIVYFLFLLSSSNNILM